MADKHMQIVCNLIKAVTNVADRGTSSNNQGSSSISVEETIKRLFPSTQGGQGTNATTPRNTVLRDQSAVEQERNENPDRLTVASIARFNPSTVYRPKAGKRAKSSSSKAPKKQRTKASGTERKSVKDVILLPGPKVNCVPKGVAREELYVRGFTTTFDLSLSMNEEEIRQVLEEKFKDKLGNILAGTKFIFVRAVSNKIVVPSLSKTESFDGRMLKHFAGQGPIYIRALADISSVLIKGQWKRIEHDSSGSGDESDDDPSEPCPGSLLHPASPDISTTKLLPKPSTSTANEPSCSRNVISCPTCHNAFPVSEIEQHADVCAEEKYGSVDENQYNNLMESFDDIDEIENTSNVETPTIYVDEDNEIPNDDIIAILGPDNHKEKINEAVYRLNKLVPDKQNKYHIRRKTIFDDYVNTRVRCKWMKPENKIRVAFVGEMGIDGGGPKREFLSGN